MQQVTNTLVMVRPSCFRMNEETAVNNYFQNNSSKENVSTINEDAQREFDDFVAKLNAHGIEAIVFDNLEGQDTPDAIFPNNWISFHANGAIALYPMFAENRRLERREDVLTTLESKGFLIENVVDYTSAEEEEIFLEGTGSMILDRENRIAYCALSLRSDEDLFIEFCEDFEFTPVVFAANQSVEGIRKPIYHTNVMLCVAESFAIVCLECIDDKKERKNVSTHLKTSGKDIIAITEAQMHSFAGNMLQVKGADGKLYLVMSASAYASLTPQQIQQINSHCDIIYSDLKTIETYGGGSARCMLAEVFLPKQELKIV